MAEEKEFENTGYISSSKNRKSVIVHDTDGNVIGFVAVSLLNKLLDGATNGVPMSLPPDKEDYQTLPQR